MSAFVRACNLRDLSERQHRAENTPVPGEIGSDILLECDAGVSGEHRAVAALHAPLVNCATDGFALVCSPVSPLLRAPLSLPGYGDLRLSGVCTPRRAGDMARLRRFRDQQELRSWRLHLPGAGVVAGRFIVAQLEAMPGAGNECRHALELRTSEPLSLLVAPPI